MTFDLWPLRWVRLSRTSVRNYHYWLRNNPEWSSSRGKVKATVSKMMIKVQNNTYVYFLLGLKQQYYVDLEIGAADSKLWFNCFKIKQFLMAVTTTGTLHLIDRMTFGFCRPHQTMEVAGSSETSVHYRRASWAVSCQRPEECAWQGEFCLCAMLTVSDTACFV